MDITLIKNISFVQNIKTHNIKTQWELVLDLKVSYSTVTFDYDIRGVGVLFYAAIYFSHYKHIFNLSILIMIHINDYFTTFDV